MYLLLMLQREADERERQRREAERREIQLKAAKEKLEQLRQTAIGAKVFNDMDEEVAGTLINVIKVLKWIKMTLRKREICWTNIVWKSCVADQMMRKYGAWDYTCCLVISSNWWYIQRIYNKWNSGKKTFFKKTCHSPPKKFSLNLQLLADMDTDEIMQKQVEQLEKEKKEMQEKLRTQEKKVSAVSVL